MVDDVAFDAVTAGMLCVNSVCGFYQIEKSHTKQRSEKFGGGHVNLCASNRPPCVQRIRAPLRM
jgi:hypothetical protein